MIGGWIAASIAGVALGALIGSSRTARDLHRADARIPASPARFRRHSGGDRDLRPHASDGARRDRASARSGRCCSRRCTASPPSSRVSSKSSGRSVFRAGREHAKISLPSAAPDILAGLRLGLTVSLILAVVCEMIAGLDGLGQWVLLAARAYKSADIFAGVVLLGAIGLVANAALSRSRGGS